MLPFVYLGLVGDGCARTPNTVFVVVVVVLRRYIGIHNLRLADLISTGVNPPYQKEECRDDYNDDDPNTGRFFNGGGRRSGFS
mmetsp:Transcript_89144/g.238795  ORF Transcript_89144/g.238795 Transcript_89144/m.238795 type:complete len:83 (+) Transcript_89144:2274-2522(+)